MPGATRSYTSRARRQDVSSHEAQLGRRRAGVVRVLFVYAVTALALVSVIFVLPRAMPGDPLSAVIDPESGVFFASPEVRARLEAYYGLDRPLPEQYVSYLASIARGDLGWSISRNAPVRQLVVAHLPWTLLLMGSALALASVVSYLAGVTAAWRRGRVDDRLVIVVMTGLRAVPEYALASALLIAFAVLVPVFPLAGGRTVFARHASWLHSTVDVAHHLALPLVALTLSLMGTKFLLVRNTVIGVLGQDYMLLARAKGLPQRLLKYRHAGRNALLPFLTVLGVQAAFAVGGTIFVEAVFAYPGMGTLILEAVEARDYPVLEAVFLTLAATVLLANLAIDLLYQRLDPRAEATLP
ncbi:MAG: ABC transporter permease [Actinomycetota bacterium]|nr:ABC transporter permease [Actinomycetota bacterium]